MLSIELLKYHHAALPRLAEIWLHGLGRIWLPDVQAPAVIQHFQTHLGEDVLPITWVALWDGIPVGMASLRVSDGILPELTPWLGSVVVDPAYQRQGIARSLIQAVSDKAWALGYEKMYLFAFDPTIPRYYAKLGWHPHSEDMFRGHPVNVMQFERETRAP